MHDFKTKSNRKIIGKIVKKISVNVKKAAIKVAKKFNKKIKFFTKIEKMEDDSCMGGK